jgi:6-phosphofructokinase 1
VFRVCRVFYCDRHGSCSAGKWTSVSPWSKGGSVIGTGRGGGDVPKIVDAIERQGINQVYVIGGNGSHAGANAISHECAKRGLKVSVIGVPKTIDNDILHIDKTFGFDTAVEEAQKAIKAG